ncbi:hypothetical protein BJ322DRAFT_1210832 [Thelephora terrestris]|uniref:NACHT domain-containing protein n=1 Tax=Thelephora terrestris TaxID=56493 RepID=A0A9P6HGV2_9AGAM|nr:hypothetical protein BJ322DRAFT_1210832 [Thelephora terrestris]
MKNLLKLKRKKLPEPPHQSDPSGDPPSNAAGPSGFVSASVAALEDESGGIGSIQHPMDEDQEIPALDPLRSGFLTGIPDRMHDVNTGGETGGKEIESAEASRFVKRARRGTLLGDASEATEKFGPLKVSLGLIPALFVNREGSGAAGKKIENLLSHVARLEEHLNSRPSDVAEQRRRDALIRNFKGIEGQLRSLSGKQEWQQPTDHARDDEDVFGLLDDLQEAILNYQMGRRGVIEIVSAQATVLNNFRYARQAEYRHGNRNGCLKGTRREILDEIELWAHDFGKPPVYWLNGLAGTGKTTIAQTIAERMFADGRLGASFFCSWDFEDRSNLQSIFPTIGVQLARPHVEFRSIFVPLVQSDPDVAGESLYSQMKKLIVQPLVESAISTVIVIDALDECKDDETASAILSVIGQFVDEIPKVKFFVTGRPEPRIQNGFRLPLLAKATDVFVLHKVEPSQINNDIQLFFKHSFSEPKGRPRAPGDWPTEEQLNTLCDRAGGLFVYAVATVSFIHLKNKNPKTQLDRLLRLPGNSAFEGKTKFRVNTTLNLLYMTILHEAFGDEDPEDDPKFRSVLGAVVLSANPLSPSTIATLLGLEAEDVLPFLSLIHSLLVLQEEDLDHIVRPFHKSFPDFIIDTTRCTNPRFRVSPPDQHAELLIGCLELMNCRLELNMCKLPDAVMNLEVPDLRERTEEHIDKALEYASRSWYRHLLNTTQAQTLKIMPILRQFLEKKFLFWLEVLSVLGGAREAIDALEATAGWLNDLPTLELVRDYTRFVLTFFEVISTSASHIYISALPLSPQSSIVHRLYQQYACPLRLAPLNRGPDLLTAISALSDSEGFVASSTSGDPWLFIDTGMEVKCLGMTENTITAVDWGKAITWSIPEQSLLNATVDVNDSIRVTLFDHSPLSINHQRDHGILVSRDSSRVLMWGQSGEQPHACLEIYDMFSGRCLVGVRLAHPYCSGLFTPDGFGVRSASYDHMNNRSEIVWKVIEDSESGTTKLEPLEQTMPPLEEFPSQSSCGHEIMDDGWIISPTKKWLLWLPDHWRSDDWHPRWSGQTLVLMHHWKSEVVILEFFE